MTEPVIEVYHPDEFPSSKKPKRRRKKKKSAGIGRPLLILFSIMPVGCLLALFLGLGISWYLYPTRYVETQIAELAPNHAEEVVVMVATDYASHQDPGKAQQDIANHLNVANPAQYVALVAERMVARHRGPVTEEIGYVVRLADDLQVSTVSMIQLIATPTFTPMPTSTPINTPLPTVEAVAVSNVSAESETVSAEAASAETESEPTPTEIPTETPLPTDTPTSEPTATETAIPFTPTPAPPTDTPTPEPSPTPSVDFYITEQRLFTKEENGGCLGLHSIFVNVVDANGNPIRGVEMGDEWGAINPGPKTGHKGDDKPGLAMYDLYKNGYKIYVKNDPTAGRPVTSETSELLSSNDWEIGIPRLIEAGYCPDEGTCSVLWNSGVFGVGNNSLCWGHYSWALTFQRAW